MRLNAEQIRFFSASVGQPVVSFTAGRTTAAWTSLVRRQTEPKSQNPLNIRAL